MNIGATSVLLIGAYERENFGDQLFLLQTRRYLQQSTVTATAPFSAQPSAYLDEPIASYTGALLSESPDAVWSVGGEVGGTTLDDAFRMSSSDASQEDVAALPAGERRRRLEALSGLDRYASPYLPRMSGSPATMHSTFIANSVGLIGLASLRGPYRDEAVGSLREASFISVRDNASSHLLKGLSIGHKLAPDLIHSISLNGRSPGKAEPDVALVQMKGKMLEAVGIEVFARSLAQSAALSPFRVRLFSAGSARGHDSLELYEEVIKEFRSIAPGRQIEMSTAVGSWDKADEIARCGIWIGTSLHGLIISSAFDVPRVALQLHKLARYAESWDETMPVNVPLSDLNGAVEAALADAHQSQASGRAMELAHLAETNALEAVSHVRESREDRLVADREALNEAIRKRKRAIAGRLAVWSSERLRKLRR